jgi:ankyrin repeat protein
MLILFCSEQGFNMGINDALDAGVDVNSRRNAKSALLRTIVDGKKVNLDSARLLLRFGADTDFQDANGNTFLHLAVAAAHVSAVDAVLRHSPSLELKNNTGLTAWGLAQTKKGGGNVDIVRNLLVTSWKRYKNKRSEDKEIERNREIGNNETGKESPPLGGAPCAVRKSLISAANCGAQDQIKSLLADPTIDVNEQSAKVSDEYV